MCFTVSKELKAKKKEEDGWITKDRPTRAHSLRQ